MQSFGHIGEDRTALGEVKFNKIETLLSHKRVRMSVLNGFMKKLKRDLSLSWLYFSVMLSCIYLKVMVYHPLLCSLYKKGCHNAR